MPNFVYKAVNKEGEETEGVITATSYKDAFVLIKRKGFYPTEIFQETHQDKAGIVSTKGTRFLRTVFQKRIKPKHLTPLVSDLAILSDSGISLVRALTIIEKQDISGQLLRVIQAVRADVEAGQTFSDALSKHPEIFSKLFINMVRAGELGGLLSESLERLAVLYEKSARLESKIIAALTYPILVLVFACAVVVFVVAFAVPKFFVIFNDMQTELPVLTMSLYNLSSFMRDWWLLVVILLVGGSFSLKFFLIFPQVRFIFDSLLLRFPVFGKLFSKVSISRFCRTFGTLLASGVPILQTLSIAKEAAGNMVYEKAIERVKESIKEGESVAAPLSQFSLFPPLVSNMITVGEETGELSHMLIKIADRYDDDVDVLIGQLTSLIEPILMVGLGVIVLFIVVALFLPLMTIVEQLTGM
jgi:type IV pilus assembly protein PilC